MTDGKAELHPPLPVPDEVSAPFWAGVHEGKLVVQRCDLCGTLQFPFAASCASCREAELSSHEVCGRGTVYAVTENVTGARHPYFEALTPYLVGNVELVEQEGLIFMSNFPGSSYDDVEVGAPVIVEFHDVAAGVRIPQFRLIATSENGE